MKLAEKRKFDGCFAVVLIFLIFGTAVVAYDFGRKKTISEMEKELMMSDKVKELKAQIEYGKDWAKRDAEAMTNTKKVIYDIAFDLDALSDTLEYVSNDYVKVKLRSLAVKILYSEHFEDD